MSKNLHDQPAWAALSGLSLALCLAAGVPLAACGKNEFKSNEHPGAADTATTDLENQDPSDAIATLQSALVSDPGNAQYLSIMATAYAQRAGIDPLTLASKISSSSSSLALTGPGRSSAKPAKAAPRDSSSTSSYTALFADLPAATTQNLADIDEAVDILTNQIPVASRQPGDVFKTAIYLTASLVLQTKALDALGTGTLTAAEISTLSDASAESILSNLSVATTLLASASGSGTGDTSSPAASAAASKILAQYSTEIAAEPGTTDADKLRSYLAAHPGATTSAASGT